MKRKDVMYLSLAVVMFAITGILAYSQLAPRKSSEVRVEVVAPISPDFSKSALDILTDSSQARNFTPAIDLNNGLGNTKPFNPI